MKFKEWIINEGSEKYSWLDPKGFFHPVPEHLTHSSFASLLTGSNNIGDMFSKGWFRITYYGKDLYANSPKMPLNQRQIKSLTDYAIENKFERVFYDNDEDEKLIWSIQNEMALDLSKVSDPFEGDFPQIIGKKKILLYHGTSTKYFWQIIEQGFFFDPTRKNWESTSAGVYFAFDIDRAESYTFTTTKNVGGEPIIFVLEIPMKELERDLDDAIAWDKQTKLQTVIRKHVESKHITGVIYPTEISPGEQNYTETPIRKFINMVNKGKIPAIPPKEEATIPKRFKGASMTELEELIVQYLGELANYTSFTDYLYGSKWLEFNQKILRALHLPEYSWGKISNWRGEDWVKFLEDVLDEENTEDYYKTHREFQQPTYKAIRRYYDRESFLTTRKGKK